MEPGWDGDVELHDSGYCDVGLWTGFGGSGGVGGSICVDGTDHVDSDGGVGGGCFDSDGAEIGGSQLYRSGFRIE